MKNKHCIVCRNSLKKGAKKYCSIQCTGADRIGVKRPPFSQQWKDKISSTRKERKIGVGNKINLGRKHGEKEILRRSLQMTGSNHWNWKGGITNLSHSIRNIYLYRQWRSDVYTRDNYTCQKCFKRGGDMEVDHFPKTFSEIFKENNIDSLEKAIQCAQFWNINNGRTLCKPCHKYQHYKK